MTDDTQDLGHWRLTPNKMLLLIPENDHGIPAGYQDPVALLREHCRNPDIVHFIADMMEP